LANSSIQELSSEKSKTSQEGETERKDRTSDILKIKKTKTRRVEEGKRSDNTKQEEDVITEDTSKNLFTFFLSFLSSQAEIILHISHLIPLLSLLVIL
jgi:hypothetical protein